MANDGVVEAAHIEARAEKAAPRASAMPTIEVEIDTGDPIRWSPAAASIIHNSTTTTIKRAKTDA